MFLIVYIAEKILRTNFCYSANKNYEQRIVISVNNNSVNKYITPKKLLRERSSEEEQEEGWKGLI